MIVRFFNFTVLNYLAIIFSFKSVFALNVKQVVLKSFIYFVFYFWIYFKMLFCVFKLIEFFIIIFHFYNVFFEILLWFRVLPPIEKFKRYFILVKKNLLQHENQLFVVRLLLELDAIGIFKHIRELSGSSITKLYRRKFDFLALLEVELFQNGGWLRFLYRLNSFDKENEKVYDRNNIIPPDSYKPHEQISTWKQNVPFEIVKGIFSHFAVDVVLLDVLFSLAGFLIQYLFWVVDVAVAEAKID